MDRTPFVIDDRPRLAIDASWSPKKKALVAGLSLAATAGAVFGGLSLWNLNAPPPRPESAAEAVAFIQSGRYEKLDADRRRSYARDASTLLRNASEEERRELMSDPELREHLGDLRRDVMDDMVLRWAKGEEVENPFAGMRPPRREDGENQERPEGMPSRSEMQQMARQRIAENSASGNAQMSGLRGEMFKQRRAERAGSGGGDGRRSGPR